MPKFIVQMEIEIDEQSVEKQTDGMLYINYRGDRYVTWEEVVSTEFARNMDQIVDIKKIDVCFTGILPRIIVKHVQGTISDYVLTDSENILSFKETYHSFSYAWDFAHRQNLEHCENYANSDWCRIGWNEIAERNKEIRKKFDPID